MLQAAKIWDTIVKHMPRNQWFHLQDIYTLVDKNVQLDNEDFEPQSPTSDLPKWKRNVRNVLQSKKQKGDIEWDGKSHYRINN